MRFRNQGSALAFAAALAINLTITPQLGGAGEAFADSTIREFTVPSGTLEQALNAYGLQTGLGVVYDANVVAGRTSSGAQGSLATDQALSEILSGTGLIAMSAGPGSVIISVAQNLSRTPVLLNTIVVQDTGEADLRVNVSSDDLARAKPTDLQDVFVSEPTIEVSSPLPVSQKLYVNGVEETQLAVTIDGGRQNNKIFHHNATTLIDPSLLKAIAINPGVAPADVGPAALGGSVEYETKDVDDLLAQGETFGGFVTGSYETNGDIFTISGSSYGRAEGFEVLGYAKYANGDTRTDGSNNIIIGSKADLLSALAKAAFESDDGHRLELSYERVEDEGQRPFRADIGRVVVGRPVPDERFYGLERQNIVLRYTDESPSDLWDPEFTLAYSVTDLQVTDADFDNFGKTDSFNGSFKNTFGFDMGAVTAGVDFFRDKGELEYFSLPDPTVDNDEADERVTNLGVFAQARLEVTDELYVSFGGRGDYNQLRGTSGFKESNTGFSANGSFQYQINDILSFGAGAAHVFGGIPLAENFIMSSAWVYDGSVEPVEANSFYGAVRADFGSAYVDGKVFKTNIYNARMPSFRGGPAADTADLRSKGFELGAGVNWENGFARVGYSNIDTDIDGRAADGFSGRYLTTPLGQIITIETAQAFPDYGVVVGADARIALEENDTFNFGFPAGSLEPFEVFNAFIEYTPEQFPSLTLRGEVNNIFDETYASRGTYGQEFVGEVEPLLEPGRSFILSATLTW
ncbi:MAG: TonB-dependent receptor [Pseudomonadota bacterium]